MIAEMIDHTTLTTLAGAGDVHSTHVIGRDGGWCILVKYGTTQRVLAEQGSQRVRIFPRLDTLVDYLKMLGLARFNVDAEDYDSHSIPAVELRDRAAAMENAQPVAGYSEWLEAEVQEAIDDTTPTIEHDEAMRQVRAAMKRGQG